MLKLTTAAVFAAVAIAATPAFAGLTQPAEVDVDLTNRFAQGDQVTARYNADPDVFIGCGMRKIRTGAGTLVATGFCQAKDAADDTFTCTTDDIGLIDAMNASGDFGFVTFSWNEDGTCRRIGFSNQSFYLPKKLDRN